MIAIKNMTYLVAIAADKNVQDLHTKNYKTLMTQINGDMLCSWVKGPKNKMSILAKLIYRFKEIPTKIPEKKLRIKG